MKILIIPSWYPTEKNRMTGSFFQEQAALLQANGYDVKILLGRVLTYGPVNYLRSKFTSTAKVRLNKSFLIQGPEALSFSVIQQRSWDEKRKYLNLFSSYDAAFSGLVKEGWIPDLIHAQCAVDAGIIADHLSSRTKIPYVLIEHQVFSPGTQSAYKQELIIHAFQQAKRVGAVSNYQRKRVLENPIKCDPVVVWNLVDESRFRIAPARASSKFRILTVSYPDPIKDMDTFFKSMAAFCKLSSDEMEIVVVGNSSFQDLGMANSSSFESLAKKYNVHKLCTFIPYLSREGISYIMNTADVFVSTSIAETFGLSVREAMLCGVPVIVTKSGGVEDTVNEKTGILVSVGDHQAIAEALLKIKNKALKFDPVYIRDFVISQCGKKAFINHMQNFYS